jgi:nitroreductase
MDPVLTRRSIRKYTKQNVSNETVTKLLQAAMLAPSADDERPWHFIVVTDDAVKRRITNIHPFANAAEIAPVVLMVCGDETLQKIQGFWVQDCSAATENILIEAQAQGLGAVWMGIYPIEGRIEAFRQLLDIPGHIIPFSLVALGYPAEMKEPGNRFDKSRIHFHDKW